MTEGRVLFIYINKDAYSLYIYINNTRPSVTLCVYVYIYIFIYTHTHTHTYMCVCVCVYGVFNNAVDSSHMYKHYIRQILAPINLSNSTDRRQPESRWYSQFNDLPEQISVEMVPALFLNMETLRSVLRAETPSRVTVNISVSLGNYRQLLPWNCGNLLWYLVHNTYIM